MPPSYALSISHFVSSVGADAGFAALIGLAILVLLYFAHARETATLRSQLAAATQRLEELERRLAGGTGPAVARNAAASPAAAAAPATVSAPASARAATKQPLAAPAGVGAPPLSDATRAVPNVAESKRELVAEPGGGRAGSTAVPAAAGGAVRAGPRAAVPAAPLTAPQGTGAGAPTEALVQGQPGTGGVPRVTPPPPGVARTPSPATAAAGGNGFPAASAGGGAVGAPSSLLEEGIPGGGRKTARWLVPALAIAALVAIAVLLVVVLTSGSSHHKTVAHHAHAVNIAAAPPGVVPNTVMVDVVNATNINQLAHHVGDRLTSKGFKEGTLATGSTQSATTTTVGYLAGHRDDALAVAHVLKLPASAVRAATQDTVAQVCPSITACAADVVVVAGSNVAPER